MAGRAGPAAAFAAAVSPAAGGAAGEGGSSVLPRSGERGGSD